MAKIRCGIDVRGIPFTFKKEPYMGDKGGKKDKRKDEKQKVNKKEQEERKKKNKLPKKSP